MTRPGEGAAGIELIAMPDVAAYVAVEASGNGLVRTATGGAAFGIALSGAVSGERVRVALPGQLVENPSWSWSPGRVNYTGTGALTQGAGSRIGYAIGRSRVVVAP
jgi:hypothetical protein